MTTSDDEFQPPQHASNFGDAVRDTAYFLWEQDGRPIGRDDYYWNMALEQHLRTRAFDVWLKEGQPDGRAEENWTIARQNMSGS